MREDRRDKLTTRQYVAIGGVMIVVFVISVWSVLMLSKYLVNYIGPVY